MSSSTDAERRSRALLALILLVPAASFGTLAGMWLWKGGAGQWIYAACKVWLVALPAFWLLKVDRGRPSWSPPRRGGLLVGLVLGAVIGLVIVGAYIAIGGRWLDVERFRASAEEIGIGTPARYIGFAVYISTVNALMEEYVWRWFVFRRCEVIVRGAAAVLLSALLFTVHHVIALRAQMPWAATILASLGVFTGGALWSWCYLRYRSIWPGYVSHAVVNVVMFAVGWAMLFGDGGETAAHRRTGPATTYRVLVDTDLGGDPDDVQSLYRLIHYSDTLRVEGIVSSPGPGSTPRVALIREWIRRVDVDHLRSRGYGGLMAEKDLLERVRAGSRGAGAPGPGRSSEGSRLIVERARAEDPEGRGRPLWVLVWGSMTTLAQALRDDPSIASRIRIYSIGSSNTVADPASRDWVFAFMKDGFPRLWWIENGILPRRSRDTFRGVYQGDEETAEQ